MCEAGLCVERIAVEMLQMCFGVDECSGDSLGGWGPETGDGPPASDPATSAAAHYQPWSAADSMDSSSAAAASCISVRMSILHELCSPSASVGPDLHRHRVSWQFLFICVIFILSSFYNFINDLSLLLLFKTMILD